MEKNDENFVEISDSSSTLNFTVKYNKVSLQYIKTYFPNASGLKYSGDRTIECIDGSFELKDGIHKYEVFYSLNLGNGKKSSKLSTHHARKVKGILSIINGNSIEKGDDSDDLDAFLKPSEKPKRKRIDDKPCTVYVGWRHKFNNFEKYETQSGRMGGVKVMKLKKSISYDLKTIADNIIIEMYNDRNRMILSNVGTKLLGTNDGDIFHEFIDDDGIPCDFWGCQSRFRMKNHTLKVFLYTTDKNYNYEKEDKDSTIAEFPPSAVTSSAPKIQMKQSQEFPICSKVTKKILPTSSAGGTICTTLNSMNMNQSTNNLLEKLQQKKHVLPENLSKVKSEPKINSKVAINIDNDDHLSLSSDCEEESENVVEKLKDLNLSIPIIDKTSFQEKNIIGRGGFGVVKIGTWNSAKVAIKKIKMETRHEYVYREMKCMDILRHPNIVMIMAVSVDDFYFYILMEHFESTSLRDLIKKKSCQDEYRIDDTHKLKILQQICRPVSFLHSYSPAIIHKDLKPANILVDKQFQVKICDLGLSRWEAMAQELYTTVDQNFHGTVDYMAPEILIHNRKGRAASDIWSIGCIIVEIFTGSLWMVFNSIGNIEVIKSQIQKNGRSDCSKVPKVLHNLLDGCFKCDPTDRISSIELSKAIMEIESHKLCGDEDD